MKLPIQMASAPGAPSFARLRRLWVALAALTSIAALTVTVGWLLSRPSADESHQLPEHDDQASEFTNSGGADVEPDLDRIERDRQRDAALAAALARIKAAGESNFQSADRARREVIQAYPALAADPGLREAVERAAKAQAKHVTFAALDRPVLREEASSPLAASIALAHRTGPSTPATLANVVCALSETEGSAFGFDAASGRLLWRRFVGFDTTFVPVPLSGRNAGGVLLADSVKKELVRIEARTGHLTWRCPLTAFDARPVVGADRAHIACRNGELVEVDLASGKTRSQFTLPQPLSAGPAVDAQNGFIYQLADHGNLYVLSESDKRCREVLFLGHHPGTVVAPPWRHGRLLIVCGNSGLTQATMHVLRMNEQGLAVEPVQTLEIEGHVYDPPLAYESQLYVGTSGGGLYVFDVDETSRAPLTAGPVVPPRDSPVVARLSLARNQLYVAGAGLAVFDLPLRAEAFAPQQVWLANELFLQPAVEFGEHVIHARHAPRLGGLSVSATEQSSGAQFWESVVASPMAGAPVVNEPQATVALLHPAGDLFVLPLSEIAGAKAHDEPTCRVELAQPLPADTVAIAWEDGLTVFAPDRHSDQLLVFDPVSQPPSLTRRVLPSAIACRPVKWGPHLVVPLVQGQIALVDPRSGRPVAEPFQPRFELGKLPSWQGATVQDGDLRIDDGRSTQYLLTYEASPRPRLVLKSSAASDADARQTAVPDHELPAGVAFSDRGRDCLIFANESGAVWLIDAPTQKQRWSQELGQPLSRYLAITSRGYLLSGRDGTLHLLSRIPKE